MSEDVASEVDGMRVRMHRAELELAALKETIKDLVRDLADALEERDGLQAMNARQSERIGQLKEYEDEARELRNELSRLRGDAAPELAGFLRNP